MNKIIDILLKLIDQNKLPEIRTILENMNEVDIAELHQHMDSEKFAILFRLLPKHLASEVFANLEYDEQEALVSVLTDNELNDILNRLFVDDIVDFIEEMPANVVKRILRITPDNKRSEINMLLNYPKDSAGSMMTTEYVALRKEWTVEKAMASIRSYGIDKETINILYVLDATRKLVGILEIRALLLHSLETKIGDIMENNFKYLMTEDDQEDVAQTFKKYGFIAMPVVDKEMRMVGIITIDDILQVIEDENEEDFELMSGLAPSEEPYLKTGVWNLSKKRIGWLIFLMLSATFTGAIIAKYEETLSHMVILTTFIPMLMDTGGNAGSQSSTLIIRGMALNEISNKDILKVVWKEFQVSIIIGVVLALVNYLRIVFLLHEAPLVALTVSLSVMGIVMLAKITGAILPLVAKTLKLDPAVMASPLITTVVDTFALLIYFSIAHQFLF